LWPTETSKSIANASCVENAIRGVKKRLVPHLQAGTAPVLLPPMVDELLTISHIFGPQSSGFFDPSAKLPVKQ